MGETGEVPINVGETTPRTEVAEQAQKVEVSKIDPRVYFAVGKFQIRAESIDSDRSHPWNTVRYAWFLAENEFGGIAAGETYDQTSKEKPFGLLIAEKTYRDGQGSSVFVRDLDKTQRGHVMNAIHIYCPSLPDEARHQFIR